LIELLLETKEPAAKKLENTHPDVAARLWCAQDMRIVYAKKSNYYHAALSRCPYLKKVLARAVAALGCAESNPTRETPARPPLIDTSITA
jgi:hypothetical protein